MLRVLLAALAIATNAAWGEDFAITPFSTAKPGTQLPAGWRPAMLARHKPTELVLVQDEGQVVLRVHAESAIGTAAYDMHVELDRRPQLTWRWKIDHVVAGADTSKRAGEDFAARVYVTFDVPVKSLSLVDRAKLKMAKALYGGEVPTASICYVWDNKLPPGASRFSPYTERVRTIVLRSGNDEAGKWVTEARDINADFRAAFGAEHRGATPAVTGIAIGNDTDQTRETVTAWFGDFAWRVAPVKRLVLLGGGHANVEVLRAFGESADEAIGVTLIDPRPVLVYSGMVPGVIAGHYRARECDIDLVHLASRAHASFLQSAGVLVNPAMKEVICANGTVVPYDVLSIDVGAQPLTHKATGVIENAVVVRPLEKLLSGWARVLADALAGKVRSVTMVGGGAAGVELALAMQFRLAQEMVGSAPHVRIMTDTPEPLPEFRDAVRKRLTRIMQKRDVGLHVKSPVAEVGRDFVRPADGNAFHSDATFWSAGAAAPPWLAVSGLKVDERGFLAVNDALQSVSHRDVFGAGDCATSVSNPRPRAGVFAVRAGPTLAANLRAALSGGALVDHVSSPRYLALLATGGRSAIGVWGPLSFSGGWVWNWKDRIDRRFIAKYASGEAFPPLR